MRYLEFDGDRVSRLALGTVQLGIDYGVANREGRPGDLEARKILESALEAGVNCFDTAIAYGKSEEILGRYLPKEENIHIVSKISSAEFYDSFGESLERSLRRLERESLYAMMLHDSKALHGWGDRERSIIGSARERASFEYFGVSIYNDEEMKMALDIDEISMIQIPFNLLDSRALRSGWIEEASRRGKLLFVRSVYLQGLFFLERSDLRGTLSKARKPLERLAAIAEELGMTLPMLALSYVASAAPSCVLVLGAERAAQMKKNAELFSNLPILDKELVSRILSIAEDVPPELINPSLWRLDG